MLKVINIKSGMTFIYNDQLHLMIENTNTKIARGRPVIKCKIKNLFTNAIIVETFNDKQKFEQAIVEKRKIQFLYIDNELIHFMDQKTFETYELNKKNFIKELNFLPEEIIIEGQFYNDKLFNINLPSNVVLKVVFTDDNSIKGNSVSNPRKIAKTNTNYEIFVPLFVKTNDKIIVSTQTGKYVSLAK